MTPTEPTAPPLNPYAEKAGLLDLLAAHVAGGLFAAAGSSNVVHQTSTAEAIARAAYAAANAMLLERKRYTQPQPG